MIPPSLYRVAVVVLTIACASNIMLWQVSGPDDVFANIVAVASGVVAVILVASAVLRGLTRWREEALLLAHWVWLANFIEFAFEGDASWEARVRQCGFYAAFATLALGAYLAQRLERQDVQT